MSVPGGSPLLIYVSLSFCQLVSFVTYYDIGLGILLNRALMWLVMCVC